MKFIIVWASLVFVVYCLPSKRKALDSCRRKEKKIHLVDYSAVTEACGRRTGVNVESSPRFLFGENFQRFKRDPSIPFELYLAKCLCVLGDMWGELKPKMKGVTFVPIVPTRPKNRHEEDILLYTIQGLDKMYREGPIPTVSLLSPTFNATTEDVAYTLHLIASRGVKSLTLLGEVPHFGEALGRVSSELQIESLKFTNQNDSTGAATIRAIASIPTLRSLSTFFDRESYMVSSNALLPLRHLQSLQFNSINSEEVAANFIHLRNITVHATRGDFFLSFINLEQPSRIKKLEIYEDFRQCIKYEALFATLHYFASTLNSLSLNFNHRTHQSNSDVLSYRLHDFFGRASSLQEFSLNTIPVIAANDSSDGGVSWDMSFLKAMSHIQSLTLRMKFDEATFLPVTDLIRESQSLRYISIVLSPYLAWNWDAFDSFFQTLLSSIYETKAPLTDVWVYTELHRSVDERANDFEEYFRTICSSMWIQARRILKEKIDIVSLNGRLVSTIIESIEECQNTFELDRGVDKLVIGGNMKH